MRSSLRQGPVFGFNTRSLVLTGLLTFAGLSPDILSIVAFDQASAAPETSRDIYFQNEASPTGRWAPILSIADYPTQYGESRLIVWIVAQQHLYWGGLAVGAFMFVTLLEIGSLVSQQERTIIHYDRWAHDMLRVVIGGFSVAALLGAGFGASLLVLYPDLTSYLVRIFRPIILLYILLALVLTVLAYGYYYTWAIWSAGALKYLHASVGVLANAVATTMVLLANGWSSFMLSPSGVDQYGRFLGNIWHALHTATWNAFNIHRLLSHLMLASAVFACYAAYQAIRAETDEERAEAERRSYLCLLVLATALFVLPAQGYWLVREVYAYRQQMGITLLGGLLAWLGQVRAMLVAGLFLGLNYYAWQRISIADQGDSYSRMRKHVFLILTLCVVVYITPHTFDMTPKELAAMGGQQHPVLGNYGVESAKQSAVNMMILVTIGSWYIWNRARVTLNSKQALLAGPITTGIFVGAAINLLLSSVYGYYVPANVRVGILVSIAATPFMVLVYTLIVIRGWKVQTIDSWPGRLHHSFLMRWVVFLLAFLVIWLIGLGGYLRSSVRLFWHVNEIMRDGSPWAYTHATGFAANVISLNALLFWFGLLLLFWLAQVGRAGEAAEAIASHDRRKMKGAEVHS